MCGIIGCTGDRPVKDILLKGLARLEYRGYDSAGVAILSQEGVSMCKTTEKVAALAEKAAGIPDGTTGIGHTRWATHGAVTECNAHPHRCGRVTLVHNGIIANHGALCRQMEGKPISQTDTEIAAMLMDARYDGDPRRAIFEACARMEGAYAFAVMFDDHPGKLYAICRSSPLAVMQTGNMSLLASDVSALLEYGRSYYAPEDGVLCELDGREIRFFDESLEQVTQTGRIADWDARSIDKGGYAHYMLKEIEEQPETVRRTIMQYLSHGCVNFRKIGLVDAMLTGVERIHMIGCGTAMHAGMTAGTLFERLAGVCADAQIASEFCGRRASSDESELYVLISQSGETADTLEALRMLKRRGARHVSIVNAPGSAMARESDCVLYTAAGPEISVASTKAFTAQTALLSMLAIHMGALRESGESGEMLEALLRVPDRMKRVITEREDICAAAEELAAARSAFYLGRGMDAALAREGALKLKEISYVHAEAYAAGEMKHGAISLIEPGVPVVISDTQAETHAHAQLSAREIRARGGRVIMIAMEEWSVEQESADVVLRLPGPGGPMAAFEAAACMQLLAYECARIRGLPIDQPRNLAKSVTVA